MSGEDGQTAQVTAFAVVCHPHPQFGGTLDNKVVHTLARAFNQLGAPAIRFNFRGVGTSAGSYDDGRGEIEDALAVIAYGRERWPGAALWLGGFSFGGSVVVWAAGEAAPARLVAVAPGITKLGVTGAAPPECPWLMSGRRGRCRAAAGRARVVAHPGARARGRGPARCRAFLSRPNQ